MVEEKSQGKQTQEEQTQEAQTQEEQTQEEQTQEEQTQEEQTQESSLAAKGESASPSDLKGAMAVLQQKAASAASESTDVHTADASSEVAENAKVLEVVAPVYEVKQDELGRSYATGKRKTSVVRVWIKRGRGEIKVNGRLLEKYFAREVLSMIVRQPLETVSCESAFDIMATAKGGGLSGQAGALRHGIARALYFFDPDHRPALKRAGLLTRDARIVERKKYGRPKARRSFQFSKR